jgi:cystathionine beta-lyase/cystathionine gamma-synthase
LHLAKALENNPHVSRVKYPFLPTHPQHDIAVRQMKNGGGIVAFELKGGLEAGQRFLNALQMISMTNNLGDSRTIASHPFLHHTLQTQRNRPPGGGYHARFGANFGGFGRDCGYCAGCGAGAGTILMKPPA